MSTQYIVCRIIIRTCAAMDWGEGKSLESGYTEMDGDFVATRWREFSRDNDQNGQRLANFVQH